MPCWQHSYIIRKRQSQTVNGYLGSSFGTYLYGRRMYEAMIVCPVVVGGGKRFFPDGVRLDLELVDELRFRNGALVLRYAVSGS
jgi:hypothetical protein